MTERSEEEVPALPREFSAVQTQVLARYRWRWRKVEVEVEVLAHSSAAPEESYGLWFMQ